MQNRRGTTSGASILSILLLIQFASPGRCEDGLKLKQMTSACGPQNVLISPSYFKIELPREFIVISGAAPNWKITTANTRSKLFCETPLSDFKANYITSSTQMHLTELGLMQEIPSRKRLRKIGGRTYIDFAVIQLDLSFNAFKDAQSATYRVLDDEKMPLAGGKILKRICGFNSFKTNQIPISLEILTQRGVLDRFLITTEVSTVPNVRAEGPPGGYKRVAKEMDVFRDPQMQADIKDMLEGSEPKTR